MRLTAQIINNISISNENFAGKANVKVVSFVRNFIRLFGKVQLLSFMGWNCTYTIRTFPYYGTTISMF
jgi:hypothetical protein